jgi:hypothetical protein
MRWMMGQGRYVPGPAALRFSASAILPNLTFKAATSSALLERRKFGKQCLTAVHHSLVTRS